MVVKTFMDMDQDSEEEKELYLNLALHLASDFFLKHPDKDVRLLVACCLADIFRIYAPEAPYTSPDKLKVNLINLFFHTEVLYWMISIIGYNFFFPLHLFLVQPEPSLVRVFCQVKRSSDKLIYSTSSNNLQGFGLILKLDMLLNYDQDLWILGCYFTIKAIDIWLFLIFLQDSQFLRLGKHLCCFQLNYQEMVSGFFVDKSYRNKEKIFLYRE